MKKFLRTLVAGTLALSMAFGIASCAKKEEDNGLIKVGIINNDPNESGYRTANDRDMKATFTEANGYEASFYYSLKNEEQIAAAQQFVQDEVDYLLISAAGTSG